MSLGLDPAHQQPEEEFLSTFFCRALFDYQTDNDSSLSFRKDDIIEVLTRLESGWWDGLLGQERGWFPSNYVTVISDHEADAALAAAEAAAQLEFQNPQAAIGHAHNLSLARAQNVASQEWDQHRVMPHGNLQPHSHALSQSQNIQLDTSNLTAASISLQGDGSFPRSGTQSSDFWVPQVSADGRVSAFPLVLCIYDIISSHSRHTLLWALTLWFLGVIYSDLLCEHPNGSAVSRSPARRGPRHI
jgi:son of sevenless-like protein